MSSQPKETPLPVSINKHESTVAPLVDGSYAENKELSNLRSANVSDTDGATFAVEFKASMGEGEGGEVTKKGPSTNAKAEGVLATLLTGSEEKDAKVKASEYSGFSDTSLSSLSRDNIQIQQQQQKKHSKEERSNKRHRHDLEKISKVQKTNANAASPDVANRKTKKHKGFSVARDSDSSTNREVDDTKFGMDDDDDEFNATTPEGQAALHPEMTDEQAKVAAKREYNRRNAARARQRNKEMVEDLQKKVADLTNHTNELQRANDVLRAQLEVLTAQNKELVMCREQSAVNAPAVAAPASVSTVQANASPSLTNSTLLSSMHGGNASIAQLLSAFQGGGGVGSSTGTISATQPLFQNGNGYQQAQPGTSYQQASATNNFQSNSASNQQSASNSNRSPQQQQQPPKPVVTKTFQPTATQQTNTTTSNNLSNILAALASPEAASLLSALTNQVGASSLLPILALLGGQHNQQQVQHQPSQAPSIMNNTAMDNFLQQQQQQQQQQLSATLAMSQAATPSAGFSQEQPLQQLLSTLPPQTLYAMLRQQQQQQQQGSGRL